MFGSSLRNGKATPTAYRSQISSRLYTTWHLQNIFPISGFKGQLKQLQSLAWGSNPFLNKNTFQTQQPIPWSDSFTKSMTMKFQHDFKSVPKKGLAATAETATRTTRWKWGRFQTLEIGKWKIPSCLSEEAKRGQWCLRSRAWTFWLEVRTPYLYIK